MISLLEMERNMSDRTDFFTDFLMKFFLDWPLLATRLPQENLLYLKIMRLRMAEPTFGEAWETARLDWAAERELRICRAVDSGFIMRAELDANARLSRYRFPQHGGYIKTPLEAEAYRLYAAIKALKPKNRIREEVEISHRRIAARVAAMVPYGR